MLLKIIFFFVFFFFFLEKIESFSYFLPDRVGESKDCFKDFPRLRDRFSWEQLEFFCQQKRLYDEFVSNGTPTVPFTQGQLDFFDSLQFVAENFTRDDQRIRQEIRRMSKLDRRRFEWALQGLKRNFIDGISQYDLLVMLHHPALAPGAHVGAAFLPWHREYLRV